MAVSAAVMAAALIWGAGSAWASTTIDSVAGNVGASTNGEVTGASDCVTSLGFSDVKPIPTPSGPFSFSGSANPAATPVSCSAGSGTNTSSATFTSTGTVAGNALTLSQQSQGTTSANGTLVNPSGCVDFGGSAFSRTDVTFTTTQALPYTFAGSLTTTQSMGAIYSLTKTSAPSTTVFDNTTGGLSPSLSGTLAPGTYEYLASVRVSNDVACGSGSLTDSFNYNLALHVGSDHYQVRMTGWIPQAQEVDPYQPLTLPAPLVQVPPLSTVRPLCRRIPAAQAPTTLVSTSMRGDGHAGIVGGFRVQVIDTFDWDGSQISNFSVSGHFGPTDLDFAFAPLANPAGVFATCAIAGLSHHSTSGSVLAGGTKFDLQFDNLNPLVSSAFALPAIDAIVQGSFDSNENLNLDFDTDLFPSTGVEVMRDGVLQATEIVNDASCLAPSAVLGSSGLGLVSLGQSGFVHNTGTVQVAPTASGLLGERSSQLCSIAYDTLSISGGGSTPFPAADAARATSILVAPAAGGAFVSLATAIKRGLVAGVAHRDLTSLVVDPAHPVKIKVLGHGVIVQESTLTHGRLSGGTSFGPVSGTLVVSAGVKVSATVNGRRLKAHRPDHKAPVTRATVTRSGRFAVVRLRATDSSGVARTILIVGGKVVALRHGQARIKRSQLGSVRFYSVDVLGNTERPRRVH